MPQGLGRDSNSLEREMLVLPHGGHDRYQHDKLHAKGEANMQSQIMFRECQIS